MNIAVIGSGAMGCMFGGKLQLLPDVQVTLVDAWPDHVARLKESGLHMTTDQGEQVIPVSACFPGEVAEVADLVIVFTKSMHTAGALESAKKAIGPDTIVLTLQNGLGNIEKIAKFASENNIVAGVTTIPSDLVGPGHINSHGKGKVKIGAVLTEGAEQALKIGELLNKAGLETEVCADIMVRIWEKVAFNSALNTLCGVTGLPVGGIGKCEKGRELARRVVTEVIAVAAAKGLAVDFDKTWGMVSMALDQHGGHKPSMLQDILSKRETEIDTIAGGVAAEAESLGIDAPVTSLLADLVRIIQNDYLSK